MEPVTTAAESSIAWADGALLAIDQRALPHELRWLRLTGVDDVIDAIKTLAIRGAPALGVAGAFGVALAAYAHVGDTEKATSEAQRIASARPTAVNLAWGVRRALARLSAGPDAVLAEAEQMLAEDAEVNRVLPPTRPTWCCGCVPTGRCGCSRTAIPAGWPPPRSVPRWGRCGCCTPAAGSPRCWSTRPGRCCRAPG